MVQRIRQLVTSAALLDKCLAKNVYTFIDRSGLNSRTGICDFNIFGIYPRTFIEIKGENEKKKEERVEKSKTKRGKGLRKGRKGKRERPGVYNARFTCFSF